MAGKRKINVPISFVKNMLKGLFNDKANKQEHIVDAIIGMLPDYSLEMLLELIHIENYTPIKVGDVVKFKPSRYFLDDYNIDNLIDVGLYKDGFIYGKVTDHDSYSSDFNSYSNKMKVNCYMYEGNHEIVKVPDTIPTLDLEVINESEILYFKLINNEKIKI